MPEPGDESTDEGEPAGTEPELFIFNLAPAGAEVEDPVAFVNDLADETQAGQGIIAISCMTTTAS